jgi:molybdopterin-guanine dinucleotide biosynthesis protein A
MTAKWPHTGAVLVGGASKRMGIPKGDLVLSTGLTMAESVARVLESVCAEVVAVGGPSGVRRFVPDRRSGFGPLGGIESLLASSLDDEYVVSPNDIPLMSPDLARRLTAPSDLSVTAFQTGDGLIHSLPIRIAGAALPAVTAALDRGQNAIHHLLDRLEVDRVPISDDEARGLRNINTPTDFDSLS